MTNLLVVSRSPIDVPRKAYQMAMEDLAKLLQDTKNSVDGIISRYTSLSCSATEVSEVRTCLSIALNKEVGSGSGQPQNGMAKTLHDPRAVQDWFTQAQLQLERAGSGFPAPSPGPHAFTKEGDGADDHALKVLLEEIRKTILDWSERHRVFHQQKNSSTGDTAHSRDMLGLAGTSSGLKEGVNGSLHGKGKEVQRSGSSTCQGKVTTNPLLVADLDKGEDGIASQWLQSNGERPNLNHSKKPTLPSDGLSMEKEAAHIPTSDKEESTLETAQVPEQVPLQSDSVVQEQAKELDPLVSKETTAIDVCVTPTKTNGEMANLPLAVWKPSSATAKSQKTPSLRCPVEVVSSPDWLPEGWITELKTRTSGSSAGTKDKYFCDPGSKRRFRSKKEVFAFLERGNPKPKNSPEASLVRKLELLPSSAKKSSKKAKVMESSMPSAPALPSAMGTSIPPASGASGNMFMPPFRQGQPSEWLVYESLATLPFPMFDPFYYSDNAGKSSESKGPHMPMRPWFLSGLETSRSAFMDWAGPGRPGDKGRDYNHFYPMPLFNPEVAPKSSASKNPVKRKPSGPP